MIWRHSSPKKQRSPRLRVIEGGVGRPRRRRFFAPVMGVSFAVLLVALSFGPTLLDAASQSWRVNEGCMIWGVIDGDTVDMTCPTHGDVRGRVVGYDTPEYKSRCAKEYLMAVAATYTLRWHLWTAEKVVAVPKGRDKYSRVLVVVTIDGDLVGRHLVDAGLARWYDGGKRGGWCA